MQANDTLGQDTDINENTGCMLHKSQDKNTKFREHSATVNKDDQIQRVREDLTALVTYSDQLIYLRLLG